MKPLEYASIILVTQKGEIALQLRDNKPTIVDPDCLSLFAGKLVDGESPERAIVRVVEEETTLTNLAMHFLFTHERDHSTYAQSLGASHVFIARDVDETLITVRQGQGYRTITSQEDLDHYDFAPISRDILQRYFAEFAR